MPATQGVGQDRESLAGEAAAQALRQSFEAEEHRIRLGPAGLRAEAGLRLGYTDNVFFSEVDRRGDFLISPEVALRGWWPLTELNVLRLSLGLGYEWYLENRQLSSDAPLVNPDTELAFHVFTGDFRIRLRGTFSLQQSLFFNLPQEAASPWYNFSDVGRFSRWDNRAGAQVLWDLNMAVVSANYDHETFMPLTGPFEHLQRVSELFDVAAAFAIGDQAQVGVETRGGLHDYEHETLLHDHWRMRAGPFVRLATPQKFHLTAGAGIETGRYRAAAAAGDFTDYYAYLQLSHETRLFTHALSAGREHLPGHNADNLRVTRVGYSIASPVVRHVDLGVDLSANFAEEFGGAVIERFTFYRAAVGIGWQFHKHWRASLDYELFVKESDLPLREFLRNRVTWKLAFKY